MAEVAAALLTISTCKHTVVKAKITYSLPGQVAVRDDRRERVAGPLLLGKALQNG